MVRASIMAIEMMSEERISPAASGWRAMLSMAAAAVLPCPIAGPMVLKAMEMAAAIAMMAESVMVVYLLTKIFFILLLLRDAPLLGGLLQINGNERRENDGLQRAEEQREHHHHDRRADGQNLIELFRDGLFAEDVAEQTQRQRRGLDELIQKEQRQHDRDGGNKALEIAKKAVRMDA